MAFWVLIQFFLIMGGNTLYPCLQIVLLYHHFGRAQLKILNFPKLLRIWWHFPILGTFIKATRKSEIKVAFWCFRRTMGFKWLRRVIEAHSPYWTCSCATKLPPLVSSSFNFYLFLHFFYRKKETMERKHTR